MAALQRKVGEIGRPPVVNRISRDSGKQNLLTNQLPHAAHYWHYSALSTTMQTSIEQYTQILTTILTTIDLHDDIQTTIQHN